MQPAQYPANDAEEMGAVIKFLSLLDLKRVKPDAKFLDKVPNHDGSVELVDSEKRPTGELKVQIKKIPDGATKFDCPIELVAYSTRISAPFILVCVDVGNQKAYWCHISHLMAGFKAEQQTFIVHFQQVIDEIGSGSPYFERWQALCDNYLKSVSEYPRLRRVVDEEIGLAKLSREDTHTFQQFIEEVNVLLDVDLPVVKYECFADAWKLGVSIHETNEQAVGYSIYTIPKGENAPILTHIPREFGQPKIIVDGNREISNTISFHLTGGTGPEVSVLWATREAFGNPIQAARAFVFHYMKRLVRQKQLHVHGKSQSIELLMWFARNHAHTLGLAVKDTYKTTEISYGVNVFLPMWYALAHPRMMKHFQENYGEMLLHNPFPSFEQIAGSSPKPEHPSEAEVRKMIASRGRTLNFIRTDSFSIRSLRQAVDFLISANVEEISRLDRPRTINGGLVWNCYSSEDLQHNIIAELQGAADDYAEFIKGNGFGRLDSPLISREIALVFAANPSKWQEKNLGPIGQFFRVENKDRSLPLVSFIDLDKDPEKCRRDGDLVLVDGKKLKWTTYGETRLGELSSQLPIQTVLYSWLKKDLNRRYGSGLLD